jgi:hypothetical protein
MRSVSRSTLVLIVVQPSVRCGHRLTGPSLIPRMFPSEGLGQFEMVSFSDGDPSVYAWPLDDAIIQVV